MASLRSIPFAVASRAPRPAPSTAVRWISSTSAVGRRGSGAEFGPGLPRGGGGRAGRSSRRSRVRRPGRSLALLSVAFVAGVAVYSYASSAAPATDDEAKSAASSSPPRNVIIPKAEFAFEDTAAAATAATPQQRQVANSRAQPGVYAWGSNAGGVVAPDLPPDSRSSSSSSIVKEPRRIPFFDGQALRDLRLDRDVGVAVTDKGDVLQWGVGFWGPDAAAAKDDKRPVPTLTGKDIVKVALSKDRVLALAANGTVYSLPVAQRDMRAAQQTKPETDAAAAAAAAASPLSLSWWRRALWSSAPAATTASLGLRTLTPAGLGWGERVVDVSSGLEHCLLLTSKGRVFSAVSSFESFPARGQLGVPGFTWARWQQQKQEAAAAKAPPPPLDQPHEVASLHGIPAAQIATGDYHSLVRARDGTLYAFGDNATGQLGIAASPAFPWTDTPVQVPVDALYETPAKKDSRAGAPVSRPNAPRPPPPRVLSIAAGGATSFFTVAAPASTGSAAKTTAPTVDTWSCGSGIYGSLGTGKWVHISTNGPGRVPALSGLREYSEAAGKMVPIHLAQLAMGATHACAVLANATHVASTPAAPGAAVPAAPSWGADVFFWGGNEYGQLGTGRRNNQSEPLHIAPLDRVPADADAAAGPALLDQTRERLALTPRTTVQLATGRKVRAEQRVTCGRYVTAVYTGV